MMGAYYYAAVDGQGVLCVDQIAEESQDEKKVAVLAGQYPDTIYFYFWAGGC